MSSEQNTNAQIKLQVVVLGGPLAHRDILSGVIAHELRTCNIAVTEAGHPKPENVPEAGFHEIDAVEIHVGGDHAPSAAELIRLLSPPTMGTAMRDPSAPAPIGGRAPLPLGGCSCEGIVLWIDGAAIGRPNVQRVMLVSAREQHLVVQSLGDEKLYGIQPSHITHVMLQTENGIRLRLPVSAGHIDAAWERTPL